MYPFRAYPHLPAEGTPNYTCRYKTNCGFSLGNKVWCLVSGCHHVNEKSNIYLPSLLDIVLTDPKAPQYVRTTTAD